MTTEAEDYSTLEPPSEEEQLLAALKKKADAFANKEWEAYWLREGPALLTSGWLVMHPHIPLAKVEEVCSLQFISSAVKSLSLEPCQSHEAVVGNDGVEEEQYHTESVVAVSGGGREEGVKIMAEMKLDSEMEVSSAAPEEAAVVTEPMPSCEETASSTAVVQYKTVSEASKDDSSTDEATLSSEAIVAMWNEHYNTYYWYIYETFVRGQLEGQQQREGEVEGEESQDSEAMEPQDAEVRAACC